MRRRQLLISLLILMAATGCGGGGGGGSTDLPPAAIWGQFRQNNQRTGLGVGLVQSKDAIIDVDIVDEITAENPIPSAVSGSPAIDADGRLYIGSEGGTLAGFEGADDLNRVWSVNQCNKCPAGNQQLGSLVSSPAVYTFEDQNNAEQTSIFLGSMDSAVFLYRFLEEDPIVEPSKCEVCFWRNDPVLQQAFIAADPGATVSAAFASSPTFTVNLGTGSIAGIFIGATITIEHSDGTIETQGKLYAINQDGSLRWEFPRAGDPPIGPVTSSPALSIGGTLYFTTNVDPNSSGSGDRLYSLTQAGNLLRVVSIPGLTDPSLPLSPSPVSSSTIFINTVDGIIHAFNPDGTFRWASAVEGQRITSSLAVGIQNVPTETAAPAATPTPTGTLVEPSITATPTATETPLRIDSNVLGITESGTLLVLNSRTGEVISPTGQMPSAAVEGTVVASPALSSDFFMVFGTTAGQLFSVNTANGQLPRFCSGGDDDGNLCTDNGDCVDGICAETLWPILLPRSCNAGVRRTQLCSGDEECPQGECVRPAIRSSPTLDLDGTIYVGADDGRIYAIDVVPTPAETSSPGSTPAPSASPTPTRTAETAPSITPTAEPTATVEPTATEEATSTETADIPPTPSPTPEVTEPSTPEPTATGAATEEA